jgi:hypothetical protein
MGAGKGDPISIKTILRAVEEYEAIEWWQSQNGVGVLHVTHR